MGLIQTFVPEKLIIGILFQNQAQCDDVIKHLIEKLGAIDFYGSISSFSQHSTYYNQEMGGSVYRMFISIQNLIDPSDLADIKIWTNTLEQLYQTNTLRPINLDPGILSAGRLALATTKNAGHRIALTKGIYAEITTFYARNNFHALPWTYPDFQTDTIRHDLLAIRKIYMHQFLQWRHTQNDH
jgi:hypothetical protein